MASLPLHGACFCGSVTYTVSGMPVLSAYCHCTNCQRLNGTMSEKFASRENLTNFPKHLPSFIRYTSKTRAFLGPTESLMRIIWTPSSTPQNHGKRADGARTVVATSHLITPKPVSGPSGVLHSKETPKGGSRIGNLSNQQRIYSTVQGCLTSTTASANGKDTRISQRGSYDRTHRASLPSQVNVLICLSLLLDRSRPFQTHIHPAKLLELCV
jgi:hypothetical protein